MDGDIEPGLEGLAQAARERLAEHLDVPAAEVAVVTAESRVWSDASLGCPQPGMRYAQVPVDGAYVELSHDGRRYPYHAGGDRPEPFLCEQRPTKTPTPTVTLPPDADV